MKGFLERFEDAIRDYPAEGLELEIVEKTQYNGIEGTVVNENEVWKFKIRAHNRGPLDMHNVELLVRGLNGTEVGWTFSWEGLPDQISVTIGQLDRGEEQTTDWILFKGPSSHTDGEEIPLVVVHLDNWEPGLDGLLAGAGGMNTNASVQISERVVEN